MKNSISKKQAEKAVELLQNVCTEFDCELCPIKKMLKCNDSNDNKIPIPAEWTTRNNS